MSSIDISVSYGLREYMGIVRDFGVWHQATEGGKKQHRPRTRSLLHRVVHTATIYLLAPPIFLMKRRAVGNCQFSINEHCVVRRSKSGEIELPWREVLRVHRLGQAYLIEKAEGAMPLPYRAFAPDQLQQFEAILLQNAVSTVGVR